MKPHPRVSAAGLDLVKRFEGLRRKAARLKDGGWTIGYGHTRSARQGAEVSPDDAEALLIYDLAQVSEALDAWCFTPLNQNQADALVAFAFNIGLDAFRGSAVLKRLNEGDYLQAAAALEAWRKAEFEGESLVFDALVRRRAAEKALFLTPMDGYRPAPSPVLRPTLDEGAAERRVTPWAPPVTAPLEGDRADLELDRSAAQAESLSPAAAAANLAARVDRLFADAPVLRPSVEPEPPPPPPPPPVETDGPDPFEAPPVEPAPAELAHPGLISEASPDDFPDSSLPHDAPAGPVEDVSHVFSGPFGRRPRSVHETPPAGVDRQDVRLLALGLLGLAMVVGSLLAMLGGRATLTNLAIGLVGVLFLVPIAARALTARLERRADR